MASIWRGRAGRMPASPRSGCPTSGCAPSIPASRARCAGPRRQASDELHDTIWYGAKFLVYALKVGLMLYIVGMATVATVCAPIYWAIDKLRGDA